MSRPTCLIALSLPLVLWLSACSGGGKDDGAGDGGDDSGTTGDAGTDGGTDGDTDGGTDGDTDGGGDDDQGVTRRAGPFVAVDAGQLYSCALRASGDGVACWWQRRRDTAAVGQVSAAPLTGSDWSALATGWWHACAATASGTVQCWGQDGAGDAETGKARPDGGAYVALTASSVTTCGLDADGAATCWQDPGYAYGQDRAPEGPWKALDLGARSGCGVDLDGALACWGSDERGQASPPSGSGWLDVGVGAAFACALADTGQVDCWGDDHHGQVSGVPGDLDAVALAVGGSHACALETGGRVRCWGGDEYGQVSLLDVALDGSGVQAIAAGVTHSCAIDEAGDAVCWGAGEPLPGRDDHPSHGNDIQPLWDAWCVGCHGGLDATDTDTDPPDLSPGQARTWLFAATPDADLDAMVAPGDLEASYLPHKLRGTHEDVGGSGDVMPPTGPMPTEAIERVEEWIETGAGS